MTTQQPAVKKVIEKKFVESFGSKPVVWYEATYENGFKVAYINGKLMPKELAVKMTREMSDTTYTNTMMCIRRGELTELILN